MILWVPSRDSKKGSSYFSLTLFFIDLFGVTKWKKTWVNVNGKVDLFAESKTFIIPPFECFLESSPTINFCLFRNEMVALRFLFQQALLFPLPYSICL